jgi:hypothetical protein
MTRKKSILREARIAIYADRSGIYVRSFRHLRREVPAL